MIMIMITLIVVRKRKANVTKRALRNMKMISSTHAKR